MKAKATASGQGLTLDVSLLGHDYKVTCKEGEEAELREAVALLESRMRDIRDSGVTILMVDHDMELVLNLCDVIHVLDFGRIIASGPPDAIRSDPAVAAAYLGTMPATAEVEVG